MSKVKMPLKEARVIAEEVKTEIADVCESVVIAGSIRREKAEVGDIELVIVPKYITKPDLFGEITLICNLLEQRLQSLWSAGALSPRRKKNGSRIAWFGKEDSRYIAAAYQEQIEVDFFIQLPDRMDLYGWQLFLRTGPGDANQLMVTRKDQWGIKPNHIFVAEGRVTDLRDDTPIMLPDEASVFRAWGMRYVPPSERSVENYWKAIIR